jgi:hypothetical protein
VTPRGYFAARYPVAPSIDRLAQLGPRNVRITVVGFSYEVEHPWPPRPLEQGSLPQTENALRIVIGVLGGVHDQHRGRRHLNEGRQLQPIEGLGDILVVCIRCRWVHPAKPETKPIFVMSEGIRPN